MVNKQRALGESCLNLTGPLLGHIDSASVARDVEAVREALGDERLNFLGLSYGSLLGATYAELYPRNIRAVALDGNVDHSQSETYSLVTESSTYETEFNHFATWCAQNPLCALHDQDVGKLFNNLVEQADKKPIPAPECTKSGTCRADVTGEEIRINAQPMLLFKETLSSLGVAGWGALAVALAEAKAGNATLLSSARAQDKVSSDFAQLAIGCLDWSHQSKDVTDVVYKEQLAAAISPHTKGACEMWTAQVQCIGWPMPVQNPEHTAGIRHAPPILLVNSKYDPETSLVWANGLLRQMDNAVLLTRDGDGHTSYLLNGSTAAAIDSYLVNLTLPHPNTVLES